MYYLAGNVAQLSQSLDWSFFYSAPAAGLSSLCSANKIKLVASWWDKSCRHNCYFSERKFEQTIYRVNKALGRKFREGGINIALKAAQSIYK